MKKGDAAKASPRTKMGRRETEDATHPPGSEEEPTSSGYTRRPERVTRALLGLTGPGLIRLRIRGRNGDLESHLHYDASVVYESLKPSFFSEMTVL
jgi:hypothetical protein